MTTTFISAPVSLYISLVKNASQINWDVSYPVKGGKEIGMIVEKEVYELLLLLEVEEVFLPPCQVKGGKLYLSYLDTKLKVDILLKVKGGNYLAFQVKSSLDLISKFKEDKPSFKGKSYPLPGLIVIDHKKGVSSLGWKYKLLLDIAKISGVTLKEEVVSSVNKWKKLRTLKKIPLGILKPMEVKILHTLNLVTSYSDHILAM